jgi:hypothetical protein
MKSLVFACLFFLGTALVFGQALSKKKVPPIFFDDWWNVDYVKNGCELTAEQGGSSYYARPCQADRTPVDIVREFENKLEVAFASESSCHGLSLFHFTPEMASAAVKNPNAPATGAAAKMAENNWQLMLDLDGRSYTQVGRGWTLVDSERHVLNGRITTPHRMMQQVCRIAKGVGGRIEN